MAFETYPKDIQDIINYTRLRRTYPRKEIEFRELLGFGNGTITRKQMYILLNLLRRLVGGSKRACTLCGRKLEENVESLCLECKQTIQMKHGGK
jgi:hypothetical protein